MMLKPVIRLSDGGFRSTGESSGYAYGLYDFNGDGIDDIILGQPFAPPVEDALMSAGAMFSLRDLFAIPELVSETAPGPGPEADQAPAPTMPDIGGRAIASAFAVPGMHNLAARFDGLFDLSADHFLL